MKQGIVSFRLTQISHLSQVMCIVLVHIWGEGKFFLASKKIRVMSSPLGYGKWRTLSFILLMLAVVCITKGNLGL